MVSDCLLGSLGPLLPSSMHCQQPLPLSKGWVSVGADVACGLVRRTHKNSRSLGLA